MFTKQFCDWLVIMAVGLVFVTSSWRSIQAAAVPDNRDQYCLHILQQTKDQDRDCASAPLKYIGIRRSVIHLLCCLGSFSSFEVRHNYTVYMDRSMFMYIAQVIGSTTQEKEVARFVKQCHQEASSSDQLLNENDFSNWQHHSSQCKV